MSKREVWLPVVGFEGYYEVSDHGRVRGVHRVTRTANGRTRSMRGKILAGGVPPNGYRQVVLCKDGRQKSFYVHALVLEAFVGARPDGFQACHYDCNQSNNRLSNLRWDTQSENRLDSERLRRSPSMAKTIHPAVRDYLKGQRLKEDWSVAAIAARHGLLRVRLWRMVQKHLNENGGVPTKSIPANDVSPREFDNDAFRADSTSLPDQPEDRVQRT